MTMQKNQ